MTSVLVELSRIWRRASYWYRLLGPARASLIGVILVPILFRFVPQGVDMLQPLGSSRDPTTVPNGTWDWARVAWMYAALFMLGVSSWAWARFLLGCKFPNTPTIPRGDGSVPFVQKYARRLLGIAPALCMAWAFLHVHHIAERVAAPGGARPTFYGWLAVGCLGTGLLLFLYFEVWHRFQQKQLRAVASSTGTPTPARRYRNISDIVEDKTAVRAIALSHIGSLSAFVCLALWPVWLGESIGSPAIVLFALAAWISAGSTIVYFGCRYRIPTVTLALVCALFFSRWNDNHTVRTLQEQTPESEKDNISQALDKWFDHVNRKFPLPEGQPRPLYLVAAAGGGIRAAYWPALLLSHLEERVIETRRASFAEHTFAMSGVSGGALGEIEFTALIAVGPTDKPLPSRVQWLLDKDFLSADLAKMCFCDLLQRFIPFPVGGWDRARSLEDAWAAAWDDSERPLDGNPLNRSIDSFYRQAESRDVALPALLLNGTSVETGKRIITSHLRIESRTWVNGQISDGEFLDVFSGAQKLNGQGIRLSTAAHQSARFTYFSPPGRFQDGTRIVDGGYFENSGAATLLEVLRVVQQHIWQRKQHPRSGAKYEAAWSDLQPILILIDNAPLPLSQCMSTNVAVQRDASPLEGPPRIYLHETLSPLDALLNTRDARGTFAQVQALATASPDFDLQPSAVATKGHARPITYEFHLYDRHVSLPLGWTLSGRAIAEMNAQLAEPLMGCLDPNCTQCPRSKDGRPLVDNGATCERLLHWLPELNEHSTELPSQSR